MSEEPSDQEDDDNDKSRRSNFVDFHIMNSERDMTAEPMFINVDINGKNVKMEIDTGTYFAVMSESVVNSKFKNVKLSRSTTRLVGYENNAMRPLGELKNLKVTLHGKTKLLNCLVLKGNKVPLIGRQ